MSLFLTNAAFILEHRYINHGKQNAKKSHTWKIAVEVEKGVCVTALDWENALVHQSNERLEVQRLRRSN